MQYFLVLLRAIDPLTTKENHGDPTPLRRLLLPLPLQRLLRVAAPTAPLRVRDVHGVHAAPRQVPSAWRRPYGPMRLQGATTRPRSCWRLATGSYTGTGTRSRRWTACCSTAWGSICFLSDLEAGATVTAGTMTTTVGDPVNLKSLAISRQQNQLGLGRWCATWQRLRGWIGTCRS